MVRVQRRMVMRSLEANTMSVRVRVRVRVRGQGSG